MLQPKDTNWLNGYENKPYIYAAHKRPTSDLGTYTIESKRMEKGIPCKRNSKEARVAILILHKINFKISQSSNWLKVQHSEN